MRGHRERKRGEAGEIHSRMLRYYRFNSDLPHPRPARAIYGKTPPGSGWPQHCPPIRAACAFGWDVINAFQMRFERDEQGMWSLPEPVEVHADVEFDGGVVPEPQLNAWFWEKGQQRPHVITDNVYAAIHHQVKVSTFLYLRTDPGEMLVQRGVPNVRRPWQTVEALIETDWYFPAHPWHCVLELPRAEDSTIREVVIEEGEVLCRLVPVRREQFEAVEATDHDFAIMFQEGQRWLSAHGRNPVGTELDITGTYAKQQKPATFTVRPSAEA